MRPEVGNGTGSTRSRTHCRSPASRAPSIPVNLRGEFQEMEAWVRELTAVTDHIRTILLLLSKSTSSSRDNLVWI